MPTGHADVTRVDLPRTKSYLSPDPKTEAQKRLAAKAQAQAEAQPQHHPRARARAQRRPRRERTRRERTRDRGSDDDGGGDPDDDGGYLTGPQLCRRYSVSEQTVWRWRQDAALGLPAPMTINRRNYWRLADLVEWERRRARRDPA